MRVTIVKGRFTATAVGSMVKIVCNRCARATAEYDPTSEVPSVAELRTASEQMDSRRPFTRPKQRVDSELTKVHPNAMSAMVVAPVIINGRPMGSQPIVCFYCREVGLISVDAERPNTAQFQFHPQSLNEDPEEHIRRRVVITFIPLLALDYLVRNRHVAPTATVVCAGASLQCQGRRSTGLDGRPRQDAHQILRELSIDGIPLYQCIRVVPELSLRVKNVVTYCHGVISHLDACYNEVDCLVEQAITVEMIELAHLVLNGSLRRTSGRYDDVFARLLWRFLVIRYKYAINMALIYAEERSAVSLLTDYQRIVVRMAEEGPPEIVSRSFDDQCAPLIAELRPIH